MDAFTLPTDSVQLIPQETIDSMATYLMISTIVSLVLFGLFVLFYIINQVRRWKVDSAILEIRKDLREIKTHIATTGPTNATPPVAAAVQLPPDLRDPAA
mgnify:CR=1 FL=1